MSQDSERKPTIGIITALVKEYMVAKRILENAEDISFSGKDRVRHYTLGDIFINDKEKHTVVLCLSGMGNNIAAIHASFLPSSRYITFS